MAETTLRAKCIHVRITRYRSHPLRDIRVCREADIRSFFEPTAANSECTRHPEEPDPKRPRLQSLVSGATSSVSMLLVISAIGSANFCGFSRWRELCSLCNRHHTKNTSNRSPAWNVSLCLCRDSVRQHASSDQHTVATKLEKTRVAAADDGGLPQAFEEQVSMFCKSRPCPTSASMPRC